MLGLLIGALGFTYAPVLLRRSIQKATIGQILKDYRRKLIASVLTIGLLFCFAIRLGDRFDLMMVLVVLFAVCFELFFILQISYCVLSKNFIPFALIAKYWADLDHCPVCSYDLLRNGQSNECPECGWAIPRAGENTANTDR